MYIHVYTLIYCYIHAYTNIYYKLVHRYLCSRACLYMLSSLGVNLFLCSSSISGRNRPRMASACVMLRLSYPEGTGSVARKWRISSKPLRSLPSSPSKNLSIASSMSPSLGLTKMFRPLGMGQDRPPQALVLTEWDRPPA